MKFLQIGFQNYIPADNISAILDMSTKPVQNAVSRGKSMNICFDITKGKTAKSVIITKDGFMYKSIINTHTLISRLDDSKKNNEKEDDINNA